jgi:hypothetical protein
MENEWGNYKLEGRIKSAGAIGSITHISLLNLMTIRKDAYSNYC